MDEMIWFREAFEALTENQPFPWQEELIRSFLRGATPTRSDIPTGLGKTSVIQIWLLTLRWLLSKEDGYTALPRRLVSVVDRRVVVDQATND